MSRLIILIGPIASALGGHAIGLGVDVALHVLLAPRTTGAPAAAAPAAAASAAPATASAAPAAASAAPASPSGSGAVGGRPSEDGGSSAKGHGGKPAKGGKKPAARAAARGGGVAGAWGAVRARGDAAAAAVAGVARATYNRALVRVLLGVVAVAYCVGVGFVAVPFRAYSFRLARSMSQPLIIVMGQLQVGGWHSRVNGRAGACACWSPYSRGRRWITACLLARRVLHSRVCG